MTTRRSSPADRHRMERFVALRTPSAQRYRKYRVAVERYVQAHNRLPSRLANTSLEPTVPHLELRPSVLFQRDYLVAWVDAAWLERAAPECDAIAEVRGPGRRPLLVLAPLTRRNDRSVRFLAILEHEFVHVSQALCGAVLSEKRASTAGDLLREYFQVARLEFEANFVQNVRWPGPTARTLSRLGITLELEEWCLLRGHTHALENQLRELAGGRIRNHQSTFPTFLDRVPLQAVRRFQALGLSRTTLTWFKERWANDVCHALSVLQGQGIDLAHALPLRVVGDWLRAQPATQHLFGDEPR